MSDLREHLQSIYDAHSNLTAQIVVVEAAAKGHPLHRYFEWNNKKAGDKYREHQARELIRSVKIKYVSGDKQQTTRYFVSVNREDGRTYQPAEDVAQDPILTEIVLAEMKREWLQLQSRYGHFKEFSEIVLEGLEQAA